MQAVYSTATDVKIHEAIRHEWASFQAWLFDQRRRLEHREHEIQSAAQRIWGKSKKADKQQIIGLQEELLAVARGEWLARVRHSLLHLNWAMTPDEKHILQQTLGRTQKEMVDVLDITTSLSVMVSRPGIVALDRILHCSSLA
jgi:hypothetical protein